MRKFGGLLMLVGVLAGPVSAGTIDLEYTPWGAVVHNHFEGVNVSSDVVAWTDASETAALQIPDGPLSIEYRGSYYDSWNQAEITSGVSNFESSTPSGVIQPFFDLLTGYLPGSISATSWTYVVMGASNYFWDFDAAAEATGSVDYGNNYLTLQFGQWEVIDSVSDEFGYTNTSLYRNFNFLISLADLPASAADVKLRTAEDVRALFAGLNGETGYFYSTVGVQQDRCESNSCWSLASDSWQIGGNVTAFGATAVPVPAALLLMLAGLPLLRRRMRR